MNTISRINSYYIDKITKENPSYKIHGWESQDAQNIRFNVLYNAVKLKGLSLLDVGCGVGSLLDYLNTKRVKVSYVGVDILPQMVLLAKEFHPNNVFLHQNIFEDNPFPNYSFDVVFASGIFNLDLGNNEKFMQEALSLFGKLSSKYIVFNCLSTTSLDKEAGYAYMDKSTIPYIIKKSSIKIEEYSIIDDYLQNDMSVVIKLNNRSSF